MTGEVILTVVDVGAVVTTIAGGGSTSGTNAGYVNAVGTNAEFDQPMGIAQNSTVLFIADYNNNLIRSISSNGNRKFQCGCYTSL